MKETILSINTVIVYFSKHYFIRSVLFTKLLKTDKSLLMSRYITEYVCSLLFLFTDLQEKGNLNSNLIYLTSSFERFMPKLFKYPVLIASQTKSGYKRGFQSRRRVEQEQEQEATMNVVSKERKGRQKTIAKLPGLPVQGRVQIQGH